MFAALKEYCRRKTNRWQKINKFSPAFSFLHAKPDKKLKRLYLFYKYIVQICVNMEKK